MQITLVRNATLLLELMGRRILVDPMLDPAGARPPIEQTANPVRNPTVELPFSAEEVVAGLDAVLVTHCLVCAHLEALNHCRLSRAELAAAVPGVLIPRDGETVEV